MGNCVETIKKSPAEITPSELIEASPTVRLYGPPTGVQTSFIRFALRLKNVTVNYIPSDTRRGRSDSDSPVIQYKEDTVSGSQETLLLYLDSRFPDPPLTGRYRETGTPLVVSAAGLQHRSMVWHLERLLRWAEDLAARGGKSGGNPAIGSPRMEVKKLARSYSQLLEVMLEHAQMEERVLFPILEKADRGLSKVANEEHGRDLPIMNGIKEAIKSIGVMNSVSPGYQEALQDLTSRLKTLLDNCKQHFDEEEKELLPLMEAAELSSEQQQKVMEQCLDAMQETHSRLFGFFREGLLPRDAMYYLDIIIRSVDKDKAALMLHAIIQ